MKKKKICFYQFFGIKESPKCEGWGDCSICKPDEKNKECKGYFPITISEYKVKGVEKWKDASFATSHT
jgi:hypothetical protein